MNSISSVRPQTMSRLSSPAPAAAAERERIGDVPQGERIQVSLILKRQKDVTVSTSPFQQVRRADLGATSRQVVDVTSFATRSGLKVTSESAESHTVKVEGTPAQLSKAFGVELGQYRDAAGREFRGFDGKVKLPQGVDAVLGLDNHPIAQPRMVVTSVENGRAVAPRAYIGPRIADLYNFPRGTDGSGQTIGIIELGGGYQTGDLHEFFHRINTPMPEVKSVSVDGATNAPEGHANGPDGEVALDIEVAGGVAPGAKQVVYFAPNSEEGFVNAINQAAHDKENHPNIISISWGAPEKEWTPEGLAAMNNAIKDAAALGINVYCAAGDNGSKDGEKDGKNHADMPASAQYAIGCGGTKLKSADGHITSEKVWRDLWGYGGATGGGVSDVFPATDWQKAHAQVPAPQTATGGRGVPDVAGNASPTTGYLVICDGQEMSIGGTSAVSPLYAGLNARLAQGMGGQLGYLGPAFYEHQDAFHDITEGSNGGFKAGPGWDAATGVGSPDGQKILDALKADAAKAKTAQ